MCVCDWQLVAVTVALALVLLAYGEIEGRLRSQSDRLVAELRPSSRPCIEPSETTRALSDAATEPCAVATPHRETS